MRYDQPWYGQRKCDALPSSARQTCMPRCRHMLKCTRTTPRLVAHDDERVVEDPPHDVVARARHLGLVGQEHPRPRRTAARARARRRRGRCRRGPGSSRAGCRRRCGGRRRRSSCVVPSSRGPARRGASRRSWWRHMHLVVEAGAEVGELGEVVVGDRPSASPPSATTRARHAGEGVDGEGPGHGLLERWRRWP